MAVFYLLFIAIVAKSSLANNENRVIKASYNGSLYYGYGRDSTTGILIEETGEDDEERPKMYRDTPVENMDKLLPQLAFTFPDENGSHPLDFVDIGRVTQTDTFDPESVSDWCLYYTHNFQYKRFGLSTSKPKATPVVFSLVSTEGTVFPEINATLFTPENERSMLLDYEENEKLGVNQNDLIDSQQKYLLLVRYDVTEIDPIKFSWRRMTIWYTHVGPRLVGKVLPKEVLFWFQESDDHIRYVLRATIDEMRRTITIAPDACARGFNTNYQILCDITTSNWRDIIRNRKPKDQFGICRQVEDFNIQEKILIENLDKNIKHRIRHIPFAEKSWSTFSLDGTSIDIWYQNFSSWYNTTDVTVIFRPIFLPA